MKVLRSYDKVETKEVVTLPNAMTAFRAIGGPVLGALMATKNVDPSTALATAAVLSASDAEGNVIALFASDRMTKLRSALRVVPSSIGRVGDAVADKLLGISVFLGGLSGGYIQVEQAAPILATELLTTGVTVWADRKGAGPHVSRLGKIGMAVRCLVMGVSIGASDMHGEAREVFNTLGTTGAVAAAALGAISCYTIYNQAQETLQAHEIATIDHNGDI